MMLSRIKLILNYIKKEFLSIENKKILFLSYKKEITPLGSFVDYKGFKSTESLYKSYLGDSYDVDFYEFSDISLINGEYFIVDKKLTDYGFIFFGFINIHTQLFRILIEYVKLNNIPYLQYGNSSDVDNKAYEMGLINKLGYSYIPTILCSKLSKNTIDAIQKDIGFPCVVKPIDGSNGRAVKKIENLKELKNSFKLGLYPHLVQKFIKNDGDFRVILFKNKVVLVSKRISSNEKEFRNNMSLGGNIYKSDMPNSIKIILEDISKHLSYDIVGVDVIFDSDGNYYIMEMNSGPGYLEFSDVCGIDIPMIIVDYIDSVVNKKEEHPKTQERPKIESLEKVSIIPGFSSTWPMPRPGQLYSHPVVYYEK